MGETTRQIAERMVRADPGVTAQAIADKAGVSRERVRQLLEEMGYTLECVWRKKRGTR